jgi:hypothetical protein
MDKMNIKSKTKIFLLILIITSIFTFSLLVKAITFNSNTYVEMVPAVKGTACLIDNSGNCVSGSDKDILIGMAFVYPFQDDSQRATPSVIPLVKLDGIMYRATGWGPHSTEDPEMSSCISSCEVMEEGIINQSCRNSCFFKYVHYTYSTARMSTLNPDGTEILDTALMNFTVDGKNAGLSNFVITIGSNTYKLNSVSTIKKITGVLSLDNFVSSDNLLTAKLSCVTGADGVHPDFPQAYAECDYNLIGSGDSKAFLDWGDGTSEEVFPTPDFSDIPKWHTYQQSEGAYDVTLKLVSSSGQETIVNTEHLQLPSS